MVFIISYFIQHMLMYNTENQNLNTSHYLLLTHKIELTKLHSATRT